MRKISYLFVVQNIRRYDFNHPQLEVDHDLARSCFQIWPIIGEEGKHFEKCPPIVEAKAATNIFSPSELIMRAINKNMISPDHVYLIYPKFWNFLTVCGA